VGLDVELGQFPIVLCRLSATPATSVGLEAACAAYLEELSKHRGIFVCVHDWTSAHGLSQETWRTVFDGAVLAPLLRGRCVAQAVAVTSPSLRTFATARALTEELPYPVRVAASVEAALSWCTWQLRRSEPQAV
jgi:hypothetical protein